MKINGDLVPSSSGIAHLGINGNGAGAFDMATLRPFGNIHLVSGVYHDPLLGQSGVLRFSQAAGAFQVSVNGGASFSNLSTAGGVTSIGVIGDADLTGAVDLAVPSSGFMTIQDTADGSPLLFSVNAIGLSGLYGFPTQGFNGKIVNEIADQSGDKANGSLTINGAGDITTNFIGNTLTISTTGPRGYTTTFSNTDSTVITHSLNSSSLVVNVWDNSAAPQQLIPDLLEITDANSVTLKFNQTQSGRIVIVAVY